MFLNIKLLMLASIVNGINIANVIDNLSVLPITKKKLLIQYIITEKNKPTDILKVLLLKFLIRNIIKAENKVIKNKCLTRDMGIWKIDLREIIDRS